MNTTIILLQLYIQRYIYIGRDDKWCVKELHLVEDVDVVVRQVEEDQPPQAAEGPLPHGADVAALQGQVRQVGRVLERPRGQCLYIIPPQVKLHCNLVSE